MNELFQQILGWDVAVDWQARLTTGFFDAEAKSQVIMEIRAAIADHKLAAEGAKLNSLQQQVVRHLIGLASRDASPPNRASASRPSGFNGAELLDRVVTTYPYPIATPYRAMTEDEPNSAAGAFGSLLATFEGLIHFLATVVVSAYLRGGLAIPECNRHLLGRMVKDSWATGDLMALLRDTVRLAGDCEGRLPYRDLPGHLFDRGGGHTTSLLVLESFVELRNQAWGHRGGRDEAFYSKIFGPNRDRLNEELALASWLSDWDLVRPLVVEDDGRVVKVDRLMGERRLMSRDYELRLDAGDLDHQGGDVRPETSLLLVSPGRDAYLPLFPLSLFHFQLKSQGVYFLQRPQWQRAEGRRRLRRASYVAYESRLEPYVSGPGEPATRSIERHVGRLEASLGKSLSEDPSTTAPISDEDTDYELPEVRLEQEYHLRTFAGRENLLGQIAGWIESEADGGYLLLTGPPGQGKSALMAELARREQGLHACLLHMGKSRRNPLKFLPSLISQAARLGRERFGEDAYRGDVEDLRNSLIRALEVLRKGVEVERVIVIIDALDELEAWGARVDFLPEFLPTGVHFILTCREAIPLVRTIKSRLRSVSEWKLEALTEDDLPAVLERRLRIQKAWPSVIDIDWFGLFRRLKGNPLLLQQALDRIATEVTEAGKESRPLRIEISDFPRTLNDLFRDAYDEIAEKRAGLAATSDGKRKEVLLQLLCTAREPIGFEALSELMSELGDPLSHETCRDLILKMSQFLLDTGGTRFEPWHQGLAEFVQETILGKRGRNRLEEAFSAWTAWPTQRLVGYSLRHRSAHLRAAGRWDELADMLVTPPYCLAKVESGQVFELVGDLSETISGLPVGHALLRPLELLLRAILRDVSFISRHPESLLQTIWNRAWWYDGPEARRHLEPPKGGWPKGGPPWRQSGGKLSAILKDWLEHREGSGSPWLRSLRPPKIPLDHALRVVLRGHRDEILSVAITRDSRRIVSGSRDGTVRIWDARTGVQLHCLENRETTIYKVAVSVAGLIASGSSDGTIRLWDFDGREVASLAELGGPVRTLAFSHDGRLISAGDGDGVVRTWEVASGREAPLRALHSTAVTSLAYSEDGRSLIVGFLDGHISVLDIIADEKCSWSENSAVSEVAFSPDGFRIAFASEMGMFTLAFSPSGSQHAAVKDWMPRPAWNVGIINPMWRKALPSPLLCVSFDRASQRLATGADDGIVKIWNLDGEIEDRLDGHSGSIRDLSFSDDGRFIVSGSTDRTLRIWDARSDDRSGRTSGGEIAVSGLAFAPDGHSLVTGSMDGRVHFWDIRSGMPVAAFLAHPGGDVKGVAFSPDGLRVASGGEDRFVRIWDVRGWTPTGRGFPPWVRLGRLILWVTQRSISPHEVASLPGHLGPISSIGFSTDGLRLASGDTHGAVLIWNEAGQLMADARVLDRVGIRRLAFSPDGRTILAESFDGISFTWDWEDQTNSGFRRLFKPQDPSARIAHPPAIRMGASHEDMMLGPSPRGTIGWYPEPLESAVLACNGKTFAGIHENRLHLLCLEGDW